MLLQAMGAMMKRDKMAHIEQVFHNVDIGKQGLIGLKEFQEGLNRLCPDQKDKIDSPRAREIFEAADTDNSGNLTFTEFATVTFDWQSLKGKELDRSIKLLFKKLDTDRDGQLEARDLTKFFAGVLMHSQIDATFKMMDADGDGKVTIEELEDFIFKPVSDEALEKYKEYADAMKNPTNELCERIQPESVASVCCFGLSFKLGCIFHPFGCLTCLAGTAGALLRYSKTKHGSQMLRSWLPK